MKGLQALETVGFGMQDGGQGASKQQLSAWKIGKGMEGQGMRDEEWAGRVSIEAMTSPESEQKRVFAGLEEIFAGWDPKSPGIAVKALGSLFEGLSSRRGFSGAPKGALEYAKARSGLPDDGRLALAACALIESAMEPSSRAQKSENLEELERSGFPAVLGAGWAEGFEGALSEAIQGKAKDLMGPLLMHSMSRDSTLDADLLRVNELGACLDEPGWREAGAKARHVFIGLRRRKLAGFEHAAPFEFWLEAHRGFSPSTDGRKALSQLLRELSGSDKQRQARWVGNCFLALDYGEAREAMSVANGLQASDVEMALGEELARSPQALDRLARACYAFRRAPAAVFAMESAGLELSERLVYGEPKFSKAPDGFSEVFFKAFVSKAEERRKALKEQKEAAKARRQAEDSRLDEVRRQAQPQVAQRLREAPPAVALQPEESRVEFKAEPAASEEQARKAFLEANPDIAARLAEKERRENWARREREMAAGESFVGGGLPTRGEPLWKGSRSGVASSGAFVMQSRHALAIGELSSRLKRASAGKPGNPKRGGEPLSWPEFGLGRLVDAFGRRLEAKSEEQTFGSRSVIGSQSREDSQEEGARQALMEFSAACQAYAYACQGRSAKPKGLAKAKLA